MGDVTIDDMKKHLIMKNVVKLLEKEHGVPLPNEIVEFLKDSATSAEMNSQHIQAWIHRASDIADRIVEGKADEAEYPLFWISLNGIVDEYYEKETKHRKIAEQISFKRPILDSLDELRASLIEDDLKLIRFMRHSYCHIHLHYIWHQAKVKNGKIFQVKPPYDSDARDIVARVISEHDGNQQALAKTYAEKVVASLNRLKAAIDIAMAI